MTKKKSKTKQTKKVYTPCKVTTQKRDWTHKYLTSLGACLDFVEECQKYPDPQSAWDACQHGGNMLWLLARVGADHKQLILCCSAIAAHVLPLFENKYPKDKRSRKAIEAAYRAVSQPTEENIEAARDIAGTVVVAACTDVAADFVASVPESILSLALRESGNDTLRAAAAAFAVARNAAVASAFTRTKDLTTALADDTEYKWQAKCVRRCFPINPFEKEK